MELNHQEGLTVVIITHEPDIAASTRRIVSMRDGLIIEDRATSEKTPGQAAVLGERPRP